MRLKYTLVVLLLISVVFMSGQGPVAGSGGGGGGGSSVTLTPGAGVLITGGPSYTVAADSSVVQILAPVTCASGSGTAYVCTGSAAISAYNTGATYAWQPDVNGSGGATTININSIGNCSVVAANGSTNPTSTSIIAGYYYLLTYDGSNCRLPAGPSLSHYTKLCDFTSNGNSIWSLPTSQGASVATTTAAPWSVNYLSFVATTNPITANNSCIIPPDWDGGTVTASAWWFPFAGGSAGNAAVWQIALTCQVSGVSVLTNTLGSFQTVTSVISATTTGSLTIANWSSLTMPGACAAGGYLGFSLERDHTNAADTLAQTANLLRFDLSFNTTLH